MKTLRLLGIATILATLSLTSAAADRVDFTQLPPAVKKTLDASMRDEPVRRITVRQVNGRAVYDIEFERKNAANPHLRIAEDGTILGDTRTARGVETSAASGDFGPSPSTWALPKHRLDELPAAVQQTIRREAAGREIALIDDDAIDGRKAYAVQFRERGRNPWVYVGEDGTVLRPTEKTPAPLLGTTFGDTPAAVQQTIRREIDDGEIVRIDKETERGESDIYKVNVKDVRGTYQLRVSADGRVLENTRGTERPPKRG
jgi:hypothetical protein